MFGDVMLNRLVLIAELGTELSWLVSMTNVAGPDNKLLSSPQARKSRMGCEFGWSVESPL
jgi:hypothetical protein